ncbi:MAG: insulinase family protein, partial [Candidatus Omnitrophica bacterium]|nr:insulinase family protein [Candidatus Omnitrophota bacterium]
FKLRLFFLACCTALFYSLLPTCVPHNVAAGSFSSQTLPSLPVARTVLENGMTVLIQENHAHKLVALEILVKAGSFQEELLLGSGVAHLLEHMLFKGTTNRPVGQIHRDVNMMGGSINGYTSHNVTGYTLVVPAEYFVSALALLHDMVVNPLFDEQEFAKEKEVILNEIRMNRDDPQRYLNWLFWEQMYGIAPYRFPVIGIEALFKPLTREAMAGFYERWYAPNNMIIAVAGAVDPKTAQQEIERLFAGLPMRNIPLAALPAPETMSMARHYTELFDTQVSYLRIGLPSVALQHADAPVLDVVAVLLGQGESSYLYQELVQRRRLAYAVSAYNYTPQFPGFFYIDLVLEEKNTDAAQDALFAVIDRLAKKRLEAADVQKAVNIFLHDYVARQETVESQASMLAQDEALARDYRFSQWYVDAVRRVTVKDVRRCLKNYFSRDHAVGVCLHPKKNASVGEQPERADARQGGARTVVPITLANGLRILLAENHQQPLFSCAAVFSGGTRFEQDENNGIFNLLSQMLTKGTRRRDAQAIAREIEFLGGSLQPFSGYNSFGLRLDVLSKDWQPGLQLLAEVLQESAFPAAQLEIERRLSLQAIAMEQDDIFRDTMRVLRKNLFSDYPYRLSVLGNPEAVNTLSRADMVQAYRRFCNPDTLVLSISGDFDRQALEAELRRLFNHWRGASDANLNFPAISTTGGGQRIIHEREKAQAVVMVGFPGVSVSAPDRYVLEFISELLSGSGSFLYQQIREEHGYSYTLGGSAVAGVDTGYMFAYIATAPESVDMVEQLLFAALERLRNEPVADAVLREVKNVLLGRRRVSLQSNDVFSFQLALDELYGLGIQEYERYEQIVETITAEDVYQAAQRYLSPSAGITVITRSQ